MRYFVHSHHAVDKGHDGVLWYIALDATQKRRYHVYRRLNGGSYVREASAAPHFVKHWVSHGLWLELLQKPVDGPI